MFSNSRRILHGGTILRAKSFCVWNLSAAQTVLRAEPFCTRNRSACGTVLRAELNGTRKAGEYI